MSATTPTPDQMAAAAAAAANAFRKSTIELWTLFSVAMASTMLRTFARIRAVGLGGLRPDDYFVWVGVVCKGRPRRELRMLIGWTGVLYGANSARV